MMNIEIFETTLNRMIDETCAETDERVLDENNIIESYEFDIEELDPDIASILEEDNITGTVMTHTITEEEQGVISLIEKGEKIIAAYLMDEEIFMYDGAAHYL